MPVKIRGTADGDPNVVARSSGQRSLFPDLLQREGKQHDKEMLVRNLSHVFDQLLLNVLPSVSV